MNITNRFASALLGAALIAGSALAQPPGGGGGRQGGFGGFGGMGMLGGGGLTLMLGQNKQLQDELRLDKAQIEKINDAMSKARDSMRDEFAKLADASREERAEIVKKMMETNTKAVESALKPEQIKRLHQIENQQAGIGMYVKADVQKTLKLTDDQKSKIETINDEYRKDLRELSPGGPGGFGGGGRGGFGGRDPQLTKKQEALKKDAIEKIMEVLDNDQRAAVKDLTGEPFELKLEAMFAGGGFGGAGGRGGMAFGGFGIGQILPGFMQDTLKLTDEQKKQVEQLQKEAEEKLQKILTEEQNKQLKEIRDRGPGRGGFGGGRGQGGPGGPGGPGGGNGR
jgi:Spy/CpxP family protein refolding chaperone